MRFRLKRHAVNQKIKSMHATFIDQCELVIMLAVINREDVFKNGIETCWRISYEMRLKIFSYLFLVVVKRIFQVAKVLCALHWTMGLVKIRSQTNRLEVWTIFHASFISF